jgi:hypothetical protein
MSNLMSQNPPPQHQAMPQYNSSQNLGKESYNSLHQQIQDKLKIKPGEGSSRGQGNPNDQMMAQSDLSQPQHQSPM